MSLVESDIGTIAPDWKVMPLKDLAEKPQYGLTTKAAKSGDIRFLRITDIIDQGVNWSTVPVCSTPKKKIAHILSTPQRAIEAQERIIQTTTELKMALMHQPFTKGLRHEPQKQTEIGPVPESWEVAELVSLLREPLRNGHSAKVTTDEDGIRTLTLTAVTQRDFSMENTKVTCADPHRVRDMWLRSGDIFIERANTADYFGLAALYEGPEDFAIFPDLLIRVRVDTERTRPKVLIEWLLAERCRRYYKKNARSTAGNFPKIDQGTVEKTLVPERIVRAEGSRQRDDRQRCVAAL